MTTEKISLTNSNKTKGKALLLLHLAVFSLSLSTVCAKYAASQEFMSFGFIALYTGVIFTLGIYAIIWQQVLKKISLTSAFVNKSAILVWSLIWGVSLFGETITPAMLIGIAIVFCGVVLVITGGQQIEPSKKGKINK